MDRSDATLLEFIARLTYNVDGLSAKLRLYFSQFLTFHFSKHLSRNHIQDIENKRASRSFASADKIREAGAKLTLADRCWTVAAIQLLQAEVERVDDRVVSRRLGKLVEELIPLLDLTGEIEKISVERERIREEARIYETRPVIRIPATIWPMATDFLMRCSILVYFSINGLDKTSLFGVNAFLITALTMVIVVVLGRGDRRANNKLLDSYGGVARFKVEYGVSAGQYTWLAFFLGISTFISYLLPDQLHAIAFIGLATFYFIYLRFFRLGRIQENDLVRQLEVTSQRADGLDVDENDEMIVNLETTLNASTSRLDAYVLESALFGALSFSGFLQIMASDLISFTDLEKFAQGIFDTSQALIHLQSDVFATGLAGLNNKVSLFCLVSVESLVCSIFFLAVIASRLRFSDIADKVRTAINLAHAFNTKEEALYHDSEKSEIRQSRLQVLTLRVNRQLSVAAQSLANVKPVMAYMEYFRSAGILVFLIILVSSSLFITSVLGWIFIALIAATFLYFNRGQVNVSLQARFLQLRVMFLRSAHWFFIVAISPFALAMILRNSFMVDDTKSTIAIGHLTVGSFLFVWLMLASHYDEEFGDIEKKEIGRSRSWWNIVKNLIASMVLLYCIALAFKYVGLAGADEMALIGIVAITILSYFLGYYLSKVKWFGLAAGALLGTSSMGIIFKTLHLNGANAMLLVGTIGVIVCTMIVWWKSALFHSLLLRFCLVILFLTVTMISGVFLRLDIAYAHHTLRLAPIMQALETHSGDELPGSSTALNPSPGVRYVDPVEAVKAAEWYIATYGRTVPYEAIYGEFVRTYNHHAENVLEQTMTTKQDTVLLQNALRMVRERDRILELYEFPKWKVFPLEMSLESDLLLALNRKDEALKSLQEKLAKLPYPEQQERLRAKLAMLIGTP
jgi:hypothetical protein